MMVLRQTDPPLKHHALAALGLCVCRRERLSAEEKREQSRRSAELAQQAQPPSALSDLANGHPALPADQASPPSPSPPGARASHQSRHHMILLPCRWASLRSCPSERTSCEQDQAGPAAAQAPAHA